MTASNHFQLVDSHFSAFCEEWYKMENIWSKRDKLAWIKHTRARISDLQFELASLDSVLDKQSRGE
jgi:hypothetical protein